MISNSDWENVVFYLFDISSIIDLDLLLWCRGTVSPQPELDINLPCTTVPFHQNHDPPPPLGPHPFPRNSLSEHRIFSPSSRKSYLIALFHFLTFIHTGKPGDWYMDHLHLRPSCCRNGNAIFLSILRLLGGKGGCILGYDLFAFTGLWVDFPPSPQQWSLSLPLSLLHYPSPFISTHYTLTLLLDPRNNTFENFIFHLYSHLNTLL